MCRGISSPPRMSIWIYLYGQIALHGTIEVLRHSLLEGSNGLHLSNIRVSTTNGLVV